MLSPTTIVHRVSLSASIAAVWAYISTADGISQWVGATVTMSPREGGIYEEHGQYTRGDYTLRGRVLIVEPPKRLVLSYRVDMGEGGRWPVHNVVELGLTAAGENTTLELVHKGFENLPERYRDVAHHDFEVYWSAAIARLSRLVAG